MGGKPVGLCDLHDLVEISLVTDRAAADIGGLLDADHRLRWLVAVARVKCRTKSPGGEFSVSARECGDLETAECCMRPAFAGDDVRGLMREDLVAGPAMHKR